MYRKLQNVRWLVLMRNNFMKDIIIIIFLILECYQCATLNMEKYAEQCSKNTKITPNICKEAILQVINILLLS